MLEVVEDRVVDALRALGVLETRVADVDSWFITVCSHVLERTQTLVIFHYIPRVTHNTYSKNRSLAIQLGIEW